MKSLITILKINTNSFSNEFINIGLLGISQGKIFFKYSENKIGIAEKLTSKEIAPAISNHLKLINNTIEDLSGDKLNEGVLNFNSPFFDETFYKTLSIYNKGLVQFNKPESFNVEMTEEYFEKLFAKFIDYNSSTISLPKKNKKFIQKVNSYLSHDPFKIKTDVDYKITPDKLSGIYNPLKVSFIAKNGSILCGQAIDFMLSPEVITKHLNEFTTFAYAVNDYSKKFGPHKQVNKYNIIADEPESDSPQHKIYTYLNKSSDHNPLKIIHPEGLEEIEDELIHKKFEKFSVYIEKSGS